MTFDGFRLVRTALRGVRSRAGLLLLAGGLWMLGYVLHAAIAYRDAIEVTAVVAAKDVVPATGASSERYLTRYRLLLPDGSLRTAEEIVPRRDWDARPVGSERRVRYLQDEAALVPPPWSSGYDGFLVMGGLGLVFTVVGAALLRTVWRTSAIRRRLSQRGVAADATVLDVVQTATRVNRRSLWQLRYRYRDPSGTDHEAWSHLLTAAEATGWTSGATGVVLYDPLAPAASAWLGTPPEPGDARREVVNDVKAAGRSAWRWIVALAVFFVAFIVAVVLAEAPPFRRLDAWIAARQTSLLVATASMTAAGIALLLVATLGMLARRPLGRAGVVDQRRAIWNAAGPRVWNASTYRFSGRARGAEAHDQFSMADLKRAVVDGAVFTDRLWRGRACATVAAALMFGGIFGVLVVVMPLEFKLLVLGVFGFAVGRVAWAVARA